MSILKNNSAISPSFGPYILLGQLSDDFIDLIFNYCKEAKDYPANLNLAGNIKEEYFLKNIPFDQKEYINKQLINICKFYIESYIINRQSNISIQIVKELEIDISDIWVNKQRKNEYNPSHNHGGDVSFVFYPHVPEEIKNEPKTRNGNMGGAINFSYGLDTSQTNNSFKSFSIIPQSSFTHMPSTGEIILFPSWAQHSVDAFNSENVIRYSVSGNFIFKNPEIILNY